MKKRLQGLVAGVMIGVILTSGVAIAANTTTLYNVLTHGVKIVIDGEKLTPTDVNGNIVEPIIYNGTTYLPVRAVATAIGKAVYWDGPNYTVYLGDMNGRLQYPTVELEDMVSINQKERTTDKLTDNYENRYSRAIYNEYYNSMKLEYLLNMKYSRFKATLYIPEGEVSDETCYLQIIADGQTIYTSPEMTRSSAPVEIDVNVTGYNDVKIEFSNGRRYTTSDLMVCLGNAGFYQ
ncbi:MAG: NPCBM/NEW2 domain-containing protein [Oscillospiraceae bacterium]|nr:NPCBM/NEW2 domain-containing protein [Oscillospiraceae bacterium]